jgi:branched-chain amino acid transport system substrate-binding protein
MVRRAILVSVGFGCTIQLLACDSGPPDSAVIALATGTSGSADIRLAQEEVGTIPGIHLNFVNDTLDDGTDSASELARAYRFLEEEDLVGVVGHPGSRSSLIAAAIYNEAGVVQVVPSGTSRELRDAGPWTFTLPPNDSVEGAAIAAFSQEVLGARRATVFFLTDEYGYGLREGVVAGLKAHGVEVLDEVPTRTLYQMEDTAGGDLESLVHAALDRGRPDIVILATRDYSARIIVPSVLARYPDVRFLAGDGVILSGGNRASLREHQDRIYQTLFWDPFRADSVSMDFVERYRQLTGAFPSHDHALYRDGLVLLADAVRAVGTDRRAIREYLLTLGNTRPPFHGVTGPISFTPDRVLPVFIIRADSLGGF